MTFQWSAKQCSAVQCRAIRSPPASVTPISRLSAPMRSTKRVCEKMKLPVKPKPEAAVTRLDAPAGRAAKGERPEGSARVPCTSCSARAASCPRLRLLAAGCSERCAAFAQLFIKWLVGQQPLPSLADVDELRVEVQLQRGIRLDGGNVHATTKGDKEEEGGQLAQLHAWEAQGVGCLQKLAANAPTAALQAFGLLDAQPACP